jgi:IclR family pca regulon transcriptional regulator
MVQRKKPGDGEERDPRFSQSLKRGLEILACFSAGEVALGIFDIAEKVGLSRSTTHRYAATLVELGYLEQDSERKYRLGARVTDLGAAAVAATGIAQASPFLGQLRKDTGLTVSVAVLDEQEIVCLQQLRGQLVGAHVRDLDAGSRFPAYCTAAGKLLLAHQPEAEQKRLLAATNIRKREPGTVSSKAELRAQLVSIRERGFACEDEERAADVHEVAVPVLSAGAEVVAALGVIAHGKEPTAERIASSHLAAMQRTAESISAALAASLDGRLG